jgi:glutamine---fructose-6-phosphate transaminase (isomerizing)
MCGIFGLIAAEGSGRRSAEIRDFLQTLARLSMSRGKDSSGIAFMHSHAIAVLKGDVRITKLIRSAEYKQLLGEALMAYEKTGAFAAMGHARLVTNGSQLDHENNQPVIKDSLVCIHNGIIVNDAEIWQENRHLERNYRIDTESLLALVADSIRETGSISGSLGKAFATITGTASVAVMHEKSSAVTLATNNGSLYFLPAAGVVYFASEAWYLRALCKKAGEKESSIRQVKINGYAVIETASLLVSEGTFAAATPAAPLNRPPWPVATQAIKGGSDTEVVIDPSYYKRSGAGDRYYQMLEYNAQAAANLKRCTRCILPETFPFIAFDAHGVCNYCHNYKPRARVEDPAGLERLLAPYRKKGSGPDCIVPFSGGRDSTYTLHVIKKEFGMNPIAFTYDWGMVTDLARRNAARVCGKLAVENIIVAADIRMKRKNIRKNITAWLKDPQLGTVPLFMAGDKYFFYYCNLLMAKNDLDVSIWGLNPLENTDFKTGFTGIAPLFGKERIDDLRKGGKAQLAIYFVKSFMKNPSYFNTSLFDTLGAFASRYMIRRRGYVQLFDYIAWEETKVDDVLREYDWERAIDSPSTWRIGDGTAAFYNYIYFTVAGFSEFDTFRSNQVREGQITRDRALALAAAENKPRYENLRWYLDITGVDFETTITKINQISKLYTQPL